MRYVIDESLGNFKFWSGGKEHADLLTWEELDRIGDALEDMQPDMLTETEVNDLF